MALDTTVGGANSDSYVAISEVDDFLSFQPGRNKSKWDALATSAKESLLKFATATVDSSFVFHGEKSDENQALEFPRDLHTKDGGTTFFMPDRVKNATIELALLTVEQSGQETSENVKSFRIGAFSAEMFGTSGESLPNAVLKWLRPFIKAMGTVKRQADSFDWPWMLQS